MAKIRTVKPELFRHEELFEAEKKHQLPLRIAFAGLFTCCDREGRFRWKPKQLKLDVLPYDEVDMLDVLNALLASGFILQYTVDGESYGCIPSWNKHQCLNHRERPSVLPGPEDMGKKMLDGVAEQEGARTDAYSTREQHEMQTVHTALETPGRKWKGNGKEMEQEVETEKDSSDVTDGTGDGVFDCAPSRKGIHADVWLVFQHWKTVLQHPQALLDKKREQLILQALKSGYSVSQLRDAITGCSKTPHNMGDNDRGQRYDGLHVILRDADQIERFIRIYHNPPVPHNAADKLLQANLQAGQNWLNKKQSEVQP